MFLCQVAPVAALQLSALCRRKWCNSTSVWVCGRWLVSLRGASHRFWLTVVTSSSQSQLECLWWASPSFSPIPPPFLIHYLHFSKCHHLIPFPFPLKAHLFLHPPSILGLHSLFLPLVSRLLLQTVSWWWGCCDWYAWRARGCFSAERVLSVCLCSPSPSTGCTEEALLTLSLIQHSLTTALLHRDPDGTHSDKMWGSTAYDWALI